MFLRTMCSAVCPRVLSRLATNFGRSLPQSACFTRGLHHVNSVARFPQEATTRLVGTRAMSALIDVLKDEISYEKENYELPPDMESIPANFKLTDTPGDTHMTLTREYNGEKLQIDVMVNGQEDQDEELTGEEEEEEPDVGVMFNVSVIKGEQALVFECKSDGTYLQISHCSLQPAEGDYEDSLYTGPVFYELDDRLQNEFQMFLEERGINTEVGAYLLKLVHDKEQREYMGWLEKVKAFITPK